MHRNKNRVQNLVAYKNERQGVTMATHYIFEELVRRHIVQGKCGPTHPDTINEKALVSLIKNFETASIQDDSRFDEA